jgi:hypothetical protein
MKTKEISMEVKMMYPYMTLSDETEIVHSHLKEQDGMKIVEVHFERPKPYGFDSARCKLPNYEWISRDGFSDDEILQFESFLQNSAHTIFKYAELGGISVAKAV